MNNKVRHNYKISYRLQLLCRSEETLIRIGLEESEKNFVGELNNQGLMRAGLRAQEARVGREDGR